MEKGAITLIPNFLVTGIAAMSVSIAIIIWSVGFLHTRHGATVFLLLFILLFLVGGGVAQVVFFTVGWAFATRINKPLTWWRRVLPEGIRGWLGRLWPWTLVASTVLFFIALEIAIFGYFPGVTDENHLLNMIFASLAVGLALFILTAVSGFARDIERQTEARLSPAMSR